MPKDEKDFIDWSVTPIQKQPHKLSEPINKGKGDQAIVDQFADLVKKTIGATDPGPTMRPPTKDEEYAFIKSMFPNAPETQEELEAEKNWEGNHNPINKFYEEVNKPVEQQSLKKSDDWGSRGAIDPNASEEEKQAQMTPEEWRLYNIRVSGRD